MSAPRLRWHWPLLGLAWMLASIASIHAFGISSAPVADDSYFASMLDTYTLRDYLVHRYHTWTGRLPIEALLVTIVHAPGLWRACNAVVMALLCVGLARLARPGTRWSWPGATGVVFALVMLMTPQAIYEACWWLTGSLNYLWPVTLGVWSLVPLVEDLPHRWQARLAACLAAALAAYCDQLALVLVPLTLGLCLWRARQRRASGWDWAQLALLCANAAFALSAPGNVERFREETGMRFPNFADLDVLEKLRIGLGLIERAMTDPRNYLFGTVTALALVLLWRAPLARWLKAVLAMVLAVSLLQMLLLIPHVPGEPLQRSLPPRLDGDAVWNARLYALSAWSAFTVGCVVIAAACGFWRDGREAARMLGLLLLGLASLGMMGFSPTAYLSGQRIAFLCLLALVVVGLRQLDRIGLDYGPRVRGGLLALIVVLASWRVTMAAFV
ncbi:DUF6056 family protein [Pseudoxanthomonas winnipegensis]|uniref:Uncharacterized protein n=1 Tax=Pseudoxanthomonas winnipegensis TaxID=2480810 RepID=A0A4Q8M5V6_9GAMM|nr:DUF6056 family protein [Pseudoxanthomonas winnipegensis]TAA45420.1 hypothetical protein EA655_04280 [Pseudoxanthomonas winnipegensis]